ncbi:MAG: hypothetical protein AVDCRST_MAG26-4668 [uncultured Chloroflexia bacterium]|uniref:Transposase IS4-like domain-containing protein n=1 Tax=uncultured Chloroflexia bacterium TaxID=1672391 RepID=A0A6J4K8Z3_9CHLR|nr:MAG: hypothetical protein AVDCRST_MAG26-4668 [uncultured Chloroflexia bacterium]
MSTIPQVAAALQVVLSTVATTVAGSTGFVRRQRHLTGAGFVQALVFGFLAHPAATLEHLAQSAANVGFAISPQGLAKRFTPAAAACLQQVLEAAVQQVVAAKPVAIPILHRFTGVYVLDSTTITLPDCLSSVWHGCGGSTTASAAALKVQVLWNVTTGALRWVGLQDARTNDRNAPVQHLALPAGALRIADLGYFSLAQMATAQGQGSFVLSRWYPQTALFAADDTPLDLLAVLQRHAQPTLDWEVRLGARHRLRVRLLAVRVPQEVADQRRRRIRTEAREKGQAVSGSALALAAWTICVTTVPQPLLTVAEAVVLLRVRWQIELLFKLWKSQGQVDTSRSQQPWRVLSEVYAKLLAMLVLHWVLLLSCWQYPDRSLPKATQTVQGHALALGAAVATTVTDITCCLARIARCVGAGCRLNPRRKRPNTYQLLLALSDASLS